jgi:acetyl esterase/lipase
LRSNIAFVSADYRLAPQANLNLILEDTVDAIAYVRDTLPAKVDNRIDPRKLAISGGSAGGWLALLAGIPVEGVVGALVPPPTCVVAIYPITDVDTPFYITKQRPVSYLKEM